MRIASATIRKGAGWGWLRTLKRRLQSVGWRWNGGRHDRSNTRLLLVAKEILIASRCRDEKSRERSQPQEG
ncbi:hypothetical protein BDY21DRAFT_359695 [Lineolata rhizophorae]|uniref:Uncharacterized protein n=1 Tax=Lineolata rhizophorae TaxID=578093 RepID=A0A6A6NKP2_9PEZI|nr:hypothetical protein BDY21DRAFT_359695 [Lineolata rhizophorae]